MRYFRLPMIVFIISVVVTGSAYAVEPSNLALNKSTTDNGNYSDFYSSRAVDGDYATHWSWYSSGTPSNPGWFRVDLENIYNINR